jgi:hypothetical protein
MFAEEVSMVHGDTKQRDPQSPDDEDDAAPVRPVLGKLKTDEEARLAREIEKLRGLPSRTENDGDA